MHALITSEAKRERSPGGHPARHTAMQSTQHRQSPCVLRTKHATIALRSAVAVAIWTWASVSKAADAPEMGAPFADCHSYAKAYADSHTTRHPQDLYIADQAMRGAVAGGAWRGPDGAQRGAAVGGALATLDSLGNDPAGWRGLYDMAYRLCRNAQSPITHRPRTLRDPSHQPRPAPLNRIAPPLPPPKAVPARP